MRQGVRSAGWVLLIAALGLLAMMWPQSLGGDVAYVRVDGHSMDPTLHLGDLAVVRHQSSYRVGDAVAYRIPKGEFGTGAMVIHRLVGGNGTTGYVTRGDNKTINDEWHPKTADIVGKVRYDVPGFGTDMAALTKPMNLGGLVAALTVAMMLLPSRRAVSPRVSAAGRPARARC
ncbi:MAG: signal peptidase I [Frankiaceae bacterium]|nr:signal peptidase I [Frankiaceae bacterium]